MSKKWTAETWVAEMKAAQVARESATKLKAELDQQRPTFSIKRHGVDMTIAYVSDFGTLMMGEVAIDLTPAETAQLRAWLIEVFPTVPRPAEVVR